jgi:hydrogenase nickel incorporation protein HypB
MFRKADLVVLTKAELLPHLPGVSTRVMRDHVARVMPAAHVIETSALTGEGVDAFVAWLEARRPPAGRQRDKVHDHGAFTPR